MNRFNIFIGVFCLLTGISAFAGQWEASEGRCKRIGQKESAACSFSSLANATSATMRITLSDKTVFQAYESGSENKLNKAKAVRSEEDGFTCLASIHNPKQNICYK